MRPTIFIHTNGRQLLGALLGAFSMKRASAHPDSFDVKLLRLEDTPHLFRREGQSYRRKGRPAVWRNDDLQSFSPLRRMVPQVMGFQGRALVTDPDVFAIGDVYDLLTSDMGGAAILCRHIRDGYLDTGAAFYASSVMLLDCERLKHWRWDEDIDRMFAGELDYGPWIGLTTEDPATIGEIDETWNSFDKLTPQTRLLHTTERSTQPWKTGLPVDYDTTTVKQKKRFGPLGTLPFAQGRRQELRYKPHPDPNQERFVFVLLKDALEAGEIHETFLAGCIARSEVRPDAFELLKGLGYRCSDRTQQTGRLLEHYGLA